MKSSEPTDLDDDDAKALQAAKISMAEALKTALKEVPGTIDEAELEHHQGKAAYSVEVYPEDGSTKRDVHVDAATGQVLEVTDED